MTKSRNVFTELMVRALVALAVTAVAASCVSPSIVPYAAGGETRGKIVRVEADAEKGFHWPYLLYVPEGTALTRENAPLLVLPNNTGKTSDDFAVHLKEAESAMRSICSSAGDRALPFVALMPIFPRFSEKTGGWRYYTHALDRDSLTIARPESCAVTVGWKGKRLDKNSYMRYSLDDIFIVQDDLIYRCIAADFDPTKIITDVSEFELTFLFEGGFDVGSPFNLIEFPREGGFFFKGARLGEGGTLVNSTDVGGNELRIVGISPNGDLGIRQWRAPGGEPYESDSLESIRRVDEQLIAMIGDAADKVADLGVKLRKKIYMAGFSASGSFVDRFTFLHPELVAVAAIGAPGGLPMSPLPAVEGRALRYPIGLGDYGELVGRPFDREAFAAIRRLVYMGESDTNDAVEYRDSFDKEDEELINPLFGELPIERFRTVKRLFENEGLTNTKFVSYPGVGHNVTAAMRDDVSSFLLSGAAEDRP